MRLAMWSGPRNLSTAMMYSFAARRDCAIWDEPFYGAYLRKTGLSHPMREEILDSCENDENAKCNLEMLNFLEGEQKDQDAPNPIWDALKDFKDDN